MNKNIIILIISVALISLFKKTDLGFSFWITPDINTKYIHTPNIPISINTDISIFGLFANFFTEAKPMPLDPPRISAQLLLFDVLIMFCFFTSNYKGPCSRK